MIDYQKVILVGNATKDPKEQASKKGDVTFTTFILAIGDSKGKSTYFHVVVFDKLGQAVSKYVKGGQQVLVDGRIEVRDDGRFNIVAERVSFGTQPIKIKTDETEK